MRLGSRMLLSHAASCRTGGTKTLPRLTMMLVNGRLCALGALISLKYSVRLAHPKRGNAWGDAPEERGTYTYVNDQSWPNYSRHEPTVD